MWNMVGALGWEGERWRDIVGSSSGGTIGEMLEGSSETDGGVWSMGDSLDRVGVGRFEAGFGGGERGGDEGSVDGGGEVAAEIGTGGGVGDRGRRGEEGGLGIGAAGGEEGCPVVQPPGLCLCAYGLAGLELPVVVGDVDGQRDVRDGGACVTSSVERTERL